MGVRVAQIPWDECKYQVHLKCPETGKPTGVPGRGAASSALKVQFWYPLSPECLRITSGTKQHSRLQVLLSICCIPEAEGTVMHSRALSRPKNEETNEETAWGQASGQGMH